MFTCKTVNFEDSTGWENLVNSSDTATFFQRREWLTTWIKNFPVEHETVAVFENEELIGLAPISFGEKRISLLGTTPVLGHEQVTDFGDIVCLVGKEKDVWMALIDYLSKKYPGQFFSPNFIKENSPSFVFLSGLDGHPVQTATSPYLTLPTTWEDYLQHLDRKDRHELRRKMKKLDSVKNSVYRADIDATNRKKFFDLMRKSSTEKEIFLTPRMENFFSDFMNAVDKEKLVLWFMEIEGNVAAAALAFKFKDELLLYNSGVDFDYGRLSVGLLSKVFLLKWAMNLGIKKFDFLQGQERYKYDLGAVDGGLYQFNIKL